MRINGETRQSSNTSKMIFPIDECIAVLSQGFTVLPGDVIATGTPEGVGAALGKFLKAGDKMEAEVEKIGVPRQQGRRPARAGLSRPTTTSGARRTPARAVAVSGLLNGRQEDLRRPAPGPNEAYNPRHELRQPRRVHGMRPSPRGQAAAERMREVRADAGGPV
jgi:hypothetical protein